MIYEGDDWVFVVVVLEFDFFKVLVIFGLFLNGRFIKNKVKLIFILVFLVVILFKLFLILLLYIKIYFWIILVIVKIIFFSYFKIFFEYNFYMMGC